jgi:hypothetical protein
MTIISMRFTRTPLVEAESPHSEAIWVCEATSWGVNPIACTSQLA